MASNSTGTIVSIGLIGGAAYIAGAYFGFWALPSWLSGMIGGIGTPLPSPTQSATPPPATSPNPASPAATLTTAPQTITYQTPFGTQQQYIPAQSYTSWGSVMQTAPQSFTSATAAIFNQLLIDVVTAGKDPTQLTYDGWNYYYQKRYGSFLQAAAGLDTSSTPISTTQFLVASGLSGIGPYVPLQGGYQRRRSQLQRPPVARDMSGVQRQNMRVTKWVM